MSEYLIFPLSDALLFLLNFSFLFLYFILFTVAIYRKAKEKLVLLLQGKRRRELVAQPSGLQGQLNDVSSNSIPLLLLALLATCFDHIRSSLSSLLRPLGLSHFPCLAAADDDDTRRLSVHLGSGLAGLIILAEQLNLNRLLSNWFSGDSDDLDCCCMVCLCGLRDGERVRRLSCRHVFQKRCFNGWLDHCPICRSKLVTREMRKRPPGSRT